MLIFATLDWGARRERLLWCSCIVFLLGPSWVAGAMAAEKDHYSSEELARLVVETPRIPEAELCPDGSLIVYSVSRGSVENNAFSTELLLQRLDSEGRPDGKPVRIDYDSGSTSPTYFLPRWAPNGKSFVYFGMPAKHADANARSSRAAPGPATGTQNVLTPVLLRHEVASGTATPVPIVPFITRSSMPASTGPPPPTISAIPRGIEWSPKGGFLAFRSALLPTQTLDPRRGVQVDVQNRGRFSSNNALFVLDMKTGVIEQLTDDALNVAQFDWAPSEDRLVFEATQDTGGVPSIRGDLFVVERSSRTVRTLVTTPGQDAAPSWSPDGKWIVFTSHFGEPTYSTGWPGMISADGGNVIRLGRGDDEQMSSSNKIYWSSDSRSFTYAAEWQMTKQLRRVDLERRSITHVASDETYYEELVGISGDGKKAGFIRESVAEPPELFVRRMPDGKPQQVTTLSRAFPLAQRVRTDRVNWASPDGKFTIHGLLVTQRAVWKNHNEPTGPLPTLVFLNGGPSMVRAGFGKDGYGGAILALAAEGYAVLAPNTRGRGGQGSAFSRGMRDGNSAGRLPYEDMMSGVDYLIARGISDRSQLGIFGHSYGGYLTAYATTQTNRFKAAAVHEAHVVEWLTGAMIGAPGSDWELLMRDLYGMRDPFAPEEMSRLIAESPGLNMKRVLTPTLLHFGAHSLAEKVGAPLYGALQRLKIPSEFVIYDAGHVTTRPAAVADDLQRLSAWFGYWILDHPYPDAERAASYELWRRNRQTSRDTH